MTPGLQGIGMTSQRTRDRLIQRLRDRGIQNQQVLSVMREIPRHIFVDEALASRAYEDSSLPIGHGQTISQPYIVARMTEELLKANSLHKVLEVGTGSGYQTAILARLVPEVCTVERIAALLEQARQRLGRQLGLGNVRYKHSDGSWGWKQHAPYDGILVAAAPETVPLELCQQLAEGGRMVIPSGPNGQQQLRVFTREGNSLKETVLETVSFVPLLTGEV